MIKKEKDEALNESKLRNVRLIETSLGGAKPKDNSGHVSGEPFFDAIGKTAFHEDHGIVRRG